MQELCKNMYRARRENLYKFTSKNNNKSVKIFAPRRVDFFGINFSYNFSNKTTYTSIYIKSEEIQ